MHYEETFLLVSRLLTLILNFDLVLKNFNLDYIFWTQWFFSPLWDWGRGRFNWGKKSDKTGKLGNLHTTSFSLNCPGFFPSAFTFNFRQLFINSPNERWDLLVHFLCFIVCFFTLYLLLCDYKLVKRKYEVYIGLLPEDMMVHSDNFGRFRYAAFLWNQQRWSEWW
jgi:hypothetical protein